MKKTKPRELQFKEIRDKKGNLKSISLILSKSNIFAIFGSYMDSDVSCKELAVCFSKRKDDSLKVVV